MGADSIEKSAASSEHAPVVSVIVPVYNTQDYLDACLDSLVHQTFADIEVVCVDDGSRDESGAMLDARAKDDARIRVIHQANAGVSHARNVALDAARGEFVLFVDSDDFIELNTCEKLVNVARRDGSDIVVFGGISFPSVPWIDQCFNTRDIVYRNDSFGALIYECGSHPLMCNKMYRLSMLNEAKLRFNEEFKLGEDNAFQFCTFPHARVVSYCRDTFYHYRCERAGSAVSEAEQDRVARLGKHLPIVEYVCSQWREQGFLKGQEERLLSWSSDFLFRDVRFVDWQDRHRIAAEYRRITDEYGLMAGHEGQAPELHDWTDFIRGELPVHADKPAVSVIFLSCYDETMVEQGFASLANQYVQDVELLCVDAYPERASSEVLARLVERDERARLVGGVEEALAQARGEFVLFARMRDSYDWYALRDMIAAAREVGDACDVVTVRDKFNHLRTHDTGRLQQMVANDGTLPPDTPARAWLTPAELADDLFGFSSLDGSNKLWRTSFARGRDLNAFDPASVAAALVNARRICPLPGRLMQRGTYEGITLDGARNLVRALGEAMDRLHYALETQGLLERHEKGYVNAVLSGGMCLRELMRTRETEAALLEAFVGLLRQRRVLEDHDKWWFTDAGDYAAAQMMLTEGIGAFLEVDGYGRIESLTGYIESLEAAAAGEHKEVEALRASTSFRIGQVFVNAPRKVVRLVRRLLHR